MGARKNGTRKGNMRGESLRRAPRSFLPPTKVLSRIYRVLPSGRRPKLPRGVRWHGPPEIFMRWHAICCILRHNFEKCCGVRTDLIASGWFFRYSYLYSEMLTIFFRGGGGGSWAFWGGKAQLDNGQYDCTWHTRLQKANKIYPSKVPWWYYLTKWIRIATIKPFDFCWDIVRVSLRSKRFLSAYVRHESWK